MKQTFLHGWKQIALLLVFPLMAEGAEHRSVLHWASATNGRMLIIRRYASMG